MSRWLVTLGLVLVALGLAWPWLGAMGLGRLPGDLAFGGESFRVYLPLTTSVLVSVLLSLIFWLLNR
jgi:Protein of unknown function (DUF2905)